MARKRKWLRAGKFTIEGTSSYKVGRDGRFRDNKTGRLISAANVKRRKPGRVTVAIERNLKQNVHRGKVVSVDWTYRVKIPNGVRPGDKKKYVDALVESMRERGIRTLPAKKGMAQAKFYMYAEGETRDLKTKRKFRGTTGIAHRRKIADVQAEAKSKVESLVEGGTLGTSAITGSGVQTMKGGPDTIYFVAAYGTETPVPGLDYVPKTPRKRLRNSKPKRNAAKSPKRNGAKRKR